MRIRPLHDRVLAKRLESEHRTASGIVIPDEAAEKPDQGEVIAIGEGKILQDGVDDRVLFGTVCRSNSEGQRRRASRHKIR